MTGRRTDLRKELEALKRKAEGVFRRTEKAGEGIFRDVTEDDIPRSGPRGRKGTQDAAVERLRRVALRKRPPYGGPKAGGDPVGTGGTRTAEGPEWIGAPPLSGPLGSLVPGEPVDSGQGLFYRVLTGAEAVWKNGQKIHDEYVGILGCPFLPDTPGLKPLHQLREMRPEEVCYLDIETTGLSNSPLFLVGLMYASEGRLVIDQLFARDYTEEPAVLRFLAGCMGRFSAMVTFNGVSFDLPFINERMILGGIEYAPPAMHIDLLPVSRRVVGRRTPNHKLQTLEKYVLGKRRTGDIPGRLIPGAYHEFVRTGDAGMMAGVIHHNRLDLLSMLELVAVYMSGRCLLEE